jgi:hypothetical protein
MDVQTRQVLRPGQCIPEQVLRCIDKPFDNDIGFRIERESLLVRLDQPASFEQRKVLHERGKLHVERRRQVADIVPILCNSPIITISITGRKK